MPPPGRKHGHIGLHACTHAQTGGQVENIIPPLVHRMGGGGIEIYKAVHTA